MNVSIENLDIELTESFAYYLDTLDHLPYAKVTLIDAEGRTGEGEVACALDVNGELQQCESSLAPLLMHILGDKEITSLNDVRAVMSDVHLHIARNTALKCGLEQALFEQLSKRTGKPLSTLIGATWKPARIQVTIPYLTDSAAYETRVDTLLAKSPPHIKFKIGRNAELERKAIKALHAKSPATHISVDANQAFDAKHAAAFLNGLDVSLAWAEQMVEKDDLDGWKELRRLTKTPLMADESIHTARDAALFLELKLVDYINVKLAKAGGIFEAWKVADIAKAHGVPVMLGSMLHGELGLRYNLTFGFTRDFITRDFDSYFTLKERSEPALIDESTLQITKTALC